LILPALGTSGSESTIAQIVPDQRQDFISHKDLHSGSKVPGTQDEPDNDRWIPLSSLTNNLFLDPGNDSFESSNHPVVILNHPLIFIGGERPSFLTQAPFSPAVLKTLQSQGNYHLKSKMSK